MYNRGSEKPRQKSLFSTVYRTNTDRRLIHPSPRNFTSTSFSSPTGPDPEVIYVNEKLTPKSEFCKRIARESSTQTSKTILQLAELETGCISPDSLGGTPRQDYSHHKSYSDYTLDGSCHEQSSPHSPKKYLDKPLTQTFLEKHWRRLANQNKPKLIACYLKSKSFAEDFHHPNYVHDRRSPRKTQKKSSRSLNLPDNSLVKKIPPRGRSPGNVTYMSTTAASRIKRDFPEFKKLNHLIPPVRRGRSTSPKPCDNGRLEASRKIPYIDQSKSDVSSSTTLVNTTRDKIRCLFDENLLKSDDNSITMLLSEASIDKTNTIDSAICTAVTKFRESDWRVALKGLVEVIEICRLVDQDLIYDYMPSINQRLIDLLKSPRTHVARTACQAAGHLFEYLKDTRRPEFDEMVNQLLYRTADANKFIRHDANLALDCMVTHITTFHSVRALCGKGPHHKNFLVRCATVRLLICAVVLAGADFILNPNNNECNRKRIIVSLAGFLEDRCLEVRKLAERLYKVMCKEGRFEVYLKKYLSKEQIEKIKRTLLLIHKK